MHPPAGQPAVLVALEGSLISEASLSGVRPGASLARHGGSVGPGARGSAATRICTR